MTAVPPCSGDGGKSVSAADGFEWKFYGDVEVGRKDRTDAINASFSVGLKGIGGVIQTVAKHHSHESVRHAVHEELEGGIVDDPTSFDKPASKHTIKAPLSFSQQRTTSRQSSLSSAIMIATASPVIASKPRMIGRPNPWGPGLLIGLRTGDC